MYDHLPIAPGAQEQAQNAGLSFKDIGSWIESGVGTALDNYQTNADAAKANVDYNKTINDAIESQMQLKAKNAQRIYDLAVIAVVGVLVLTAVIYAAKIFVKK